MDCYIGQRWIVHSFPKEMWHQRKPVQAKFKKKKVDFNIENSIPIEFLTKGYLDARHLPAYKKRTGQV